jgi:DNA-binding transcriptional ArsR family regulator
MKIERGNAEEYAAWFRCLADPTRLEILNLLAVEHRAMTVGEIVNLVGVAQSTVSEHLRRLAETRFVTVAHVGTKSYFEVNQRCIECLPSAAQLIMGIAPPVEDLLRPAPGVTRRRSSPRSRTAVPAVSA